jgi:hypothetical protein
VPKHRRRRRRVRRRRRSEKKKKRKKKKKSLSFIDNPGSSVRIDVILGLTFSYCVR